MVKWPRKPQSNVLWSDEFSRRRSLLYDQSATVLGHKYPDRNHRKSCDKCPNTCATPLYITWNLWHGRREAGLRYQTQSRRALFHCEPRDLHDCLVPQLPVSQLIPVSVACTRGTD